MATTNNTRRLPSDRRREVETAELERIRNELAKAEAQRTELDLLIYDLEATANSIRRSLAILPAPQPEEAQPEPAPGPEPAPAPEEERRPPVRLVEGIEI